MDKVQDLKSALFGGEKVGLIDFSQPSLFRKEGVHLSL